MTLLENIIAVEVPGRAKNFFVTDGDLMFTPHYPARGGQTVLDSCVTLPPGNWQFLFCTTDASEEQAQMVVERTFSFGRVKRYQDYEFVDSAFYTAKESLQSLLSSKGLKKNYAVLKKII